MDINSSTLQINHYKEPSFETVHYQNVFLQKIFQFEIQVSPIEQLDFVHKHELIKFLCVFITICYEHTQDILKISKHHKENDIHHMSLTSNSVRQLNVVQ